MSEPTTELMEVKQITSSVEKIKDYLPRLQKGNEVGMEMLNKIIEAKITSKAERDALVEELATVKKVYDKVNKLRTEITDPIDAARKWIMQFERDMDYGSKAENAYNRAKAVITAYDQKVLEENKKAELDAERKRQAALYKAELREKVARQLVEMMAGQQKNVIQAMARWEGSLTLGTIDQAIEQLKAQKPKLKESAYEACFKLDFDGKRPVVTDDELKLWMQEFKKEHSYEKYQEQYLQMAVPIANEYRAKMPSVKAKLQEIAKADEEKKAQLEEDRKKELEAKALESVETVNQATESKVEQIKQDTENAKMDAEFTKQAQLQDIEDGPKKYEASFEGAGWVQSFMNVIGHCIKNDKFKMLNTKGTDLIDPIKWWLTFLSTNCPNVEIPGIVWKEVPKTIIKGK